MCGGSARPPVIACICKWNRLWQVYGAQPPIELLRQLADQGGWYDRADNSWRTLADCQLLAAMGPPGGGRNPVTARLMRHFVPLAINEFDEGSLKHIYGAISDWYGG